MKRVLIVASMLAAGCICVGRGSRVLTPRGPRPIEDLEVGDEVYACKEDSGELVVTTVTAIRSGTREVGLLRFGSDELRLTSDHPVYCPEEDLYAPAGDWFLGKRSALLRVSERGRKIVAPERVDAYVGVSEVFDITVESELHNFVADGFLVHNKSKPNNLASNSELGCRIDGEIVFDGDECLCPGARVGEISCVEQACICPDGTHMRDMTVADMSLSDVGHSADADIGDVGPSDLGADAGMLRERGDCVTNDDCARDSWMCISIPADEPNGYFTCQADLVAEPGCAVIEAPDECCVHADCADDPSGTCVVGPLFYCGGVAPVIANVCLYDECANDGDCGAGESCLPPRVLGEPVRRCVASECGTDADCDTRTGGECHMFRDPCNGRVRGFFCTYTDSECRTDDDCPDDPNTPGLEHCAPGPSGDGDTFCDTFVAPP